jgi:tryptophan synthase alpha chain
MHAPTTLRSAIEAAGARGEKAMGLFLTNGFPDRDSTLPILQAADEAGADFIELGMPFSDPLAEGLPIQRSSERALKQGIRMSDAFRIAEAFRLSSQTPLVLMGYINPVLRYGVGNFCRDARSSGVQGLILPDLPPEEREIVDGEARAQGLDLISLIAPNSSDSRIVEVDAASRGFVYAVSMTGLTGTQIGGMDAVQTYLERARRLVTRNPLMVGFGIRSHTDAMRLSAHTDGFIIGSALIEMTDRTWADSSLTPMARLDAVRRFVQALKYGDSET